jgi:3-isopropylmalate/(R)-2-methylmalate dehydratase small subunit
MSTATSIKGRIWKFGNHIDTDAIIPAHYLTSTDPEFLGKHCMEGADTDFPRKVRPGDFILAGENFGCGSSREHAPLAIRGAGIACVLANSFARIFFRNAINIGLPVFEVPNISDKCDTGDILEIDQDKHQIRNITKEITFAFHPYPPFLQNIIAASGLIPAVRKKITESQSA